MPSTATTAPLDPSRAEISRAGCAYSWRRIPNRRRCSASSINPRTRWRYYAIDQRDLIRVSLEIARFQVRDHLNEDGAVREESVMRAAVAINGKERPLFFASTKVVAAVDAYLDERVRRGQGATTVTKYRRLDPGSRLFLTADGHDMPIAVRA